MQRLDPTKNAGSTQYADGNATTGAGGTILQAQPLNALQEELCSVIAAAGAALNPADNTQLVTAFGVLIKNALASGYQSGDVKWVATAEAPGGWLIANGSNVSRTAYAALFGAIGTTYGAGDGSTTFGLPDLRGVSVRGLDQGRGLDSGRTLGSFQADQLSAHTHGVTDPGHGHATQTDNTGSGGSAGNGTASRAGSLSTSANGTGISVQNSTTGISTQSTGGTEVRVKTIALLGVIKY